MHTVRWVSEQLGLAPGTLRAWEQRYGVVNPTRSGGGYRLYDDGDVETLRAMAGLVADGMQPAQAAEELRIGRTAPVAPVGGGRAVPDAPAGLPDPALLVAASRTFDTRTLDETLDAAFGAARFEYVVDEWLMGAMVAIGEGWASGTLDVSQEHFISAGIMRRLAAAFDAAGQARTGPHVVTGLAPGATHEIATLAFATMLRRAGLRVTYLGPDLPADSWVRAARGGRADAVVVGVPRPEDAPAAADVVRALEEALPHTSVHIGGAGATPDHALGGTTLAEAATWLVDALTGPGTRWAV